MFVGPFRRITAGIIIAAAILSQLAIKPALAEIPWREWRPLGEQYTPRTDGEYVVWYDERDRQAGDTSPGEIHGVRIAGGDEFVIASGSNKIGAPDIDRGIVVWSETNWSCENCAGDIAGYDTATGKTFPIATTEQAEVQPAISGNLVVWVKIDNTGTESLWGRRLDESEPFKITSTQPGWRIDLPKVDGERVIWSEYLPTDTALSRAKLLAHDLSTGETITLVSESGTGFSGLTDDYDIAGSTVTYAIEHTLYVQDLTAGEPWILSTTGSCPTTDGRYIFWEDFRNDEVSGTVELWGYDLLTGATLPVVTTPEQRHEYPHLDAGILVWQASTANQRDVFAARLADILPTAPQPDIAGDPKTYIYFPETAHPLQAEFKVFWDTSGGLPVFGYPLTAEFEERNADTGETYRVQYLERQRFEHHPEYSGTPYEVLIGRLGYAEALRRGLLESDAFQPTEPGTAGDSCHYFAETVHHACGPFLDYWRSHGLEFGDAGISYSETVALFGYPLSESFTDPVTGLTTQFFERAIFEYHPEHAGTPHAVLLRRLGADELQNRGWCAAITLGCAPAD